jgi:hypothetical protein
MDDILSTYYECTLSIISRKLNVSGHMLIWTFFPVSVRGTRAENLSAPFSHILYNLQVFVGAHDHVSMCTQFKLRNLHRRVIQFIGEVLWSAVLPREHKYLILSGTSGQYKRPRYSNARLVVSITAVYLLLL